MPMPCQDLRGCQGSLLEQVGRCGEEGPRTHALGGTQEMDATGLVLRGRPFPGAGAGRHLLTWATGVFGDSPQKSSVTRAWEPMSPPCLMVLMAVRQQLGYHPGVAVLAGECLTLECARL